MVAGDWNFAAYARDRWCLEGCKFTGDKDKKEAEHARDEVFAPLGLYELEQENHTHFCASATSRLDRVYDNHHPSEQLDHQFGCRPLKRESELSAHAAISFFRYKRPISKEPYCQSEDSSALPAINQSTIRHPDWARRVAAELAEISTESNDFDNPFRKLVLLKRAIRTVSTNMTQEELYEPAVETEDKLNATLSLIRAAQATNLAKMRRKYLEYPTIAQFVQVDNPNACYSEGFKKLMDHAYELAKASVGDELRKVREKEKEGVHDHKIQTRKSNVLGQLKKLTPGACNTIGALESFQGEILTTPDDIASELARHWKIYLRINLLTRSCWRIGLGDIRIRIIRTCIFRAILRDTGILITKIT